MNIPDSIREILREAEDTGVDVDWDSVEDFISEFNYYLDEMVEWV